MRIPVEKDRDADFVLLQAADKIAALEADAARYRGIRDKLTYVGINAHHKQELWCLRGVFADKGSFDEAIDAAMQVKP